MTTRDRDNLLLMPTPIGLDLSLTSTGWSCGFDQRILAPKTKGVARLIEVRDTLATWLDATDDPVVAVEGYSFASRNSQAHSIGELGGVIRVMLHERLIPWVEIAPTIRAKFATGRGNAAKSEVISAVSARTGIVWAGAGADDLCDAFVLEECLRHRLGMARYEWPQLNQSATEKVDWSPLLDV